MIQYYSPSMYYLKCLQFQCPQSISMIVLCKIKGSSAAEETGHEEEKKCRLCRNDSPPSRKGRQIINWLKCDSCKNWFHM